MLTVQLFFGQTLPGGGRVTDRQWLGFLRDSVTPAFPDGFTALDAYGQWLDPAAHRLVRERSKVIELALADTDAARAAVDQVIEAYKRRFRQQVVGEISSAACGNFRP